MNCKAGRPRYQETNPLLLRQEHARAVAMMAAIEDVSPEQWMSEAVESEISRGFKDRFGVHLGEYIQWENEQVEGGADRLQVRARFIRKTEREFEQRRKCGLFDKPLKALFAMAGAH